MLAKHGDSPVANGDADPGTHASPDSPACEYFGAVGRSGCLPESSADHRRRYPPEPGLLAVAFGHYAQSREPAGAAGRVERTATAPGCLGAVVIASGCPGTERIGEQQLRALAAPAHRRNVRRSSDYCVPIVSSRPFDVLMPVGLNIADCEKNSTPARPGSLGRG